MHAVDCVAGWVGGVSGEEGCACRTRRVGNGVSGAKVKLVQMTY